MKPAVLFVHSNTELYGADHVLSEVVDAVRDQVTPIVALPGPGALTDRLSQAGVRVIYTRESVLRRIRFKPLMLPGLLWNVLVDTRRLVDIVRRENVKLIYSNTSAVITGALAARVCRIPNIYHVHEIIENPTWLAKAIARIIAGNASEVIAVSGPVRDFLSGFGRLGDPPIRVIHNGLDPYNSLDEDAIETVRMELGAEGDSVLYGVIGRIHPWKGQSYFIDAARMVADVDPKARFVIIGGTFPGYEWLLEELKTRVLRLELESTLRILPYRRDIPRIMRALDVLVLPSTKPDPLPTVVLEAMAAKRPVIATAHGGSLEMVEHGRTGFLAPYHDVTGLAEVMIELARNETLRHSFGQAGSERLTTEFSRDRFRDEIRRCVQSHLPAAADTEKMVNNHTQLIH